MANKKYKRIGELFGHPIYINAELPPAHWCYSGGAWKQYLEFREMIERLLLDPTMELYDDRAFKKEKPVIMELPKEKENGI